MTTKTFEQKKLKKYLRKHINAATGSNPFDTHSDSFLMHGSCCQWHCKNPACCEEFLLCFVVVSLTDSVSLVDESRTFSFGAIFFNGKGPGEVRLFDSRRQWAVFFCVSPNSTEKTHHPLTSPSKL